MSLVEDSAGCTCHWLDLNTFLALVDAAKGRIYSGPDRHESHSPWLEKGNCAPEFRLSYEDQERLIACLEDIAVPELLTLDEIVLVRVICGLQLLFDGPDQYARILEAWLPDLIMHSVNSRHPALEALLLLGTEWQACWGHIDRHTGDGRFRYFLSGERARSAAALPEVCPRRVRTLYLADLFWV